MLKLADVRSELKVVADQHGTPTSCIDLSFALAEIIQNLENREYRGQVFHFSNSSDDGSITWADFAREIFQISGKTVSVLDCESSEYPTKARRPSFSILKNNSDIIL